MNASTASKTYANIGVDSAALAADPHKLISMLYQGALLAIAKAKNGMMRKDIAAKCAAISKAIAIIDDGLSACLDKKVGGALAQNLSALYEYMCIRLTQANIKNDMAALDEVARLLIDLKGAWETVRAPASAVAPPKPAKVPPIYAVPATPPQPQAKSAPVAAAMKTSPPKVVVAAPVTSPQQRVANKVQALYGRV